MEAAAIGLEQEEGTKVEETKVEEEEDVIPEEGTEDTRPALGEPREKSKSTPSAYTKGTWELRSILTT